MDAAIKILLVEDNCVDYELTREYLGGPRANIVWAQSLGEGILKLQEHLFDVLLLDLDVPDSHGLSTFTKLVQNVEPSRVPAIIVLTGNDDDEMAREALIHGAQDYLIKGQPNGEVLVRAIRYAIDRHKFEEQLRKSKDELVELSSQLVTLNVELIEARDKAIESNRKKTEFLANLSHEIRTPLSGIVSIAELLCLENCSEDVRDLHETLQDSATRLVSTVSDLLDMSKLEIGKMAVNIVDCEVRQLLDEVMSALIPSARVKQIRVDTKFSDAVPEKVLVDEVRLKQILMNLVHNAVKFTVRGSVTVEIDSEQNATRHLKIKVKDTGIGISEESKNRIFEPFVQAEASTTRSFGGSGLGLALCKKSAELLKGEIGVDSELGKGSTFWLRVPYGLCS